MTTRTPLFHKTTFTFCGEQMTCYRMDLPGHGTIWMSKYPPDIGGCRLSSALPGESRWVYTLEDPTGKRSDQKMILGTFAAVKARILRQYGF